MLSKAEILPNQQHIQKLNKRKTMSPSQ
ncbi:hypothetical protein TSAR_017073 [Trichomalopsis sarcophagae]|uniref:Uncharacterized protein n=1 Tax=Trichomalopsis sarcophagae TaxID=543379 RepID=A0A232EFI8_9HYME|nr:hypothetical protein TSAR_017073 [Trichomalopsis sarcophagae]